MRRSAVARGLSSRGSRTSFLAQWSVPCGRSSALDPCCDASVHAPQLAPLVLGARLASLRRSFPARITFHPRWLSRGSASPQHMRRNRSSPAAPATLRPRHHRALQRPPCGVRKSPRLGRAPSLGFGDPCDGLLPTPPRGRRRSLPQRSRDSPFGACPSSGSVPVTRPMPSCGSLVAFRTPAAGPLQGFVPRTEFLEVLGLSGRRPSGAPLGFPFQA